MRSDRVRATFSLRMAGISEGETGTVQTPILSPKLRANTAEVFISRALNPYLPCGALHSIQKLGLIGKRYEMHVCIWMRE